MSDHEHPVDPDRVARAAARAIGPDDARAVGELLDVVGDPFRMRILSALHAAGELCVGDIALALDLSEDAVGYGLRVLRGGGLVRRDPRGRMAFYALADGVRQGELLDALAQLRGLKHPE